MYLDRTFLFIHHCHVASRMLKKSASGVLASLRGSTYRSVRLMYPRKVSRWNKLPGFYSEWPCWLAFSSFVVGRAFLRVARI